MSPAGVTRIDTKRRISVRCGRHRGTVGIGRVHRAATRIVVEVAVARIRVFEVAEQVIERPVLQHQHDHVLDAIARSPRASVGVFGHTLYVAGTRSGVTSSRAEPWDSLPPQDRRA